MLIPKSFFLFFLFFNIILTSNAANNDLCSSSQLQATVSNLNSQVPSYMPSLYYDVSQNCFIASIFNNVQRISQSQCPNLIGQNSIASGITSFSVYMSCSSNGNDNGITGSLKVPVLNASTTTYLTTVNIQNGMTASNLPICPTNPDISISNRVCTIVLQATLIGIGNNYCQYCYNVPILTVEQSTGPHGHIGGCNFFDLTCYNDYGILWRSTWLWICIWIGTFLLWVFLGIILLMERSKHISELNYEETKAIREKSSYSSDVRNSEISNLNDYSLNYNNTNFALPPASSSPTSLKSTSTKTSSPLPTQSSKKSHSQILDNLVQQRLLKKQAQSKKPKNIPSSSSYLSGPSSSSSNQNTSRPPALPSSSDEEEDLTFEDDKGQTYRLLPKSKSLLQSLAKSASSKRKPNTDDHLTF